MYELGNIVVKLKSFVMKKVSLSALMNILFIFLFIGIFVNCNKEEEPEITEWDYSTFTDPRDGKSYKTIKIGNQEWMAENLAFETANSWHAGQYSTNGEIYGRLYTWESAKAAVPPGWHLPSDMEWKELEIVIGMDPQDVDKEDFRGDDEGRKLKSQRYWAEEGYGNDSFGFAALPGGYRSNNCNFLLMTWHGYWWSSTGNDNSKAWIRFISYNNSGISRRLSYVEDGYSVRCVKDNGE